MTPSPGDTWLTIAVLVEKTRVSLRRHGLRRTIALCFRHAGQIVTLPARQRARGEADAFDREHGVRTRVAFDLTEWRHILRRGGTNHDPSPADTVHAVLAQLPVRFEDTVFVDFGSGAGRAVLVAATFPFRRTVGVEISPRLHAIAQSNVAAFPHAQRRCENLELVCGDARFLPLPSEPSVLYFYNPFGVEIMARVLANVERSLAERPRPVTVIHLFTRPESLRLFDESPWFSVVHDADPVRCYQSLRARRAPVRSTA